MGKWLWNWVMGRGWKNFEVNARKGLLFCEWPVRAILMRTEKEKRRAIEKASSFFENTCCLSL